MSQHIDAIYDHGVLRPLEPLSLPDQTRVKLTVEAESSPESADEAGASDELTSGSFEEMAAEVFRSYDAEESHGAKP